MRKILPSQLIYLIAFVIGKVSIKALVAIETQVQLALGKGSGGESTSQEVKLLVSLWKERFSEKPNPIVIDGGGNHGKWTSQFLEVLSGAKVWIFEPAEGLFLDLGKKFSGSSNVKVVKRALGDSNGRVTLYADKKDSPLSSLVKRNLNFTNLSFDFEETVEVVKLGEWCKGEGITPDILKLDIEGLELKALLGSKEIIRNIKVIQFEFGGANRDSRTFFRDFWDFFTDENFSLFRISPLGLIPIYRYQEYEECFRTTNFIALNQIG